jgi:hypothetical protein
MKSVAHGCDVVQISYVVVVSHPGLAVDAESMDAGPREVADGKLSASQCRGSLACGLRVALLPVVTL